MNFSLLYPDGIGPFAHSAFLALYLQGYAKGMGVAKLRIDLDALDRLSNELLHPEFPHVDGVEGASPFKKAAYFFIWMTHHRPVLDSLPESHVGREIIALPNHQNVVIAYNFVARCLHGATLQRTDGSEVTLGNRIRISIHSMCDLIDTFTPSVPNNHFKPACLLFEQLAYKANPKAPYPEVL